MVKIALDPAMYHASMSVADEVRKAADLGYEYVELSPRADWFFWHRYPKADDAMVAEVNQAVKETGVRIASLVPVFGWSAPDEQERQAQVRNWKRLLEIADGLQRPVIMTELSGDPNQPRKSEHSFYHSMEELIPVFERYGLQLNIEAHPYDFSERNDDAVQIVRGLNRPWINYCFCIPHAFHLSDGAGDMRRMIEYAGAKLAHVHVADCYNHRANVGNRYIVNPPGVGTSSTRPAWTPGCTSTTRSATATSTGTRHSPRCATSASTASPQCACSAGKKTPTLSTAACSTG